MQCCFASFNEEKRIEIGGGNVSVRLWKILEISLWKWEKFMLKKYRSTISWCWTIGVQFSAPLVSPIASVKASLFNEGRNVASNRPPPRKAISNFISICDYNWSRSIESRSFSLFRRAFLEKSRFFLEPSARNPAASSSTSPITRGMRVDCNSRPIIASRTVNEASLQANFVNTSRKEEEERFFEQRTRRELGWNAHCVKS